MLVLAVTLHNIPEGMAVGVVFAGVLSEHPEMTLAGAIALSIGIAIQNFPEGAIISMPLKEEGVSKPKAFLYGSLSGIVEPIAAAITIAITSAVTPILPYILAISKEKEQKQEEKEVDYLKKVNKKMKKRTIAAIVSLAIIVIAIILLHIYIFSIYNKATCLISVSLEDTITRDGIDEIKTNLKNEYGDISIIYYSKEQELGKMKQKFQISGDSKNAEILDNYDGENSPFLQSLQISANSKEQAGKITEELKQLKGTRNIVSSVNLNPYEVFIKFLYGDYGKI